MNIVKGISKKSSYINDEYNADNSTNNEMDDVNIDVAAHNLGKDYEDTKEHAREEPRNTPQEYHEENNNYFREEGLPRIVVIGVGGGGCNAVNNMIKSSLKGVEFIAANTDAQSLKNSICPNKIHLGQTTTAGLGAGSQPDLGKCSAEESIDEVMDMIGNANMVFITAGMGGGTGTGASPIIAKAIKNKNILTVGVVTKPFMFEGAGRMRIAEIGIRELEPLLDTIIVIPNQNLFNLSNEETTFIDAFKIADHVLYSGIRGITDLMLIPGLINLDFADIKSVMCNMGRSIMGSGEASGEDRAIRAAENAISNPLLDNSSIKGAKGILLNVTCGPDITLFEVDQAAKRVGQEAPDAHLIFGTSILEDPDAIMRVTVFATGINDKPSPKIDSRRYDSPHSHQSHRQQDMNAGAFSNEHRGNAPQQRDAQQQGVDSNDADDKYLAQYNSEDSYDQGEYDNEFIFDTDDEDKGVLGLVEDELTDKRNTYLNQQREYAPQQQNSGVQGNNANSMNSRYLEQQSMEEAHEMSNNVNNSKVNERPMNERQDLQTGQLPFNNTQDNYNALNNPAKSKKKGGFRFPNFLNK